jgi:hypothetical protein
MRKIIVLAFCCMVLFQADLLADNAGERSILTKYDVTEEALINASPEVVYNAIIDIYDGKTSWWMPDFSSRLCQGETSGTPGALYAVTIHALLPIKFKTKTVETKKAEMLRVEYVEGAFVGEGLWLFENVEGKTKISLRWRTNPGDWFMRMVAPFYPIAKNHSSVMQAGFSKLEKFLN